MRVLAKLPCARSPRVEGEPLGGRRSVVVVLPEHLDEEPLQPRLLREDGLRDVVDVLDSPLTRDVALLAGHAQRLAGPAVGDHVVPRWT